MEAPSGKSSLPSEYDTFPICWILFHGTVGTLQPARKGKEEHGRAGQESQARMEPGRENLLSSIDELVECISGDDVATDKFDGRVGI